MIFDNKRRYPFSGANVMFEAPIPANSFDPKQWNTDGASINGSGILTSASSLFISAGIAGGDPLFLISGTPALAVATSVFDVGGQDSLIVNWMADQDYTNILFKVGEAAQHTFDSLTAIVAARNVTAYTRKWVRCWTEAVLVTFNPDETGDVYIIDPEEERRLEGMNRVNGILEMRPERL